MRLTTGFVLWLVAAAAATAVGLLAVSAIGTDIFGAGQDPLSQSEVDELLASRPAPPPTTTSSAPPPPPEKTTVTEGGTVIARCDGALVRIVSASPAQGFQVDPDDDDVDDHPTVKFQSEEQEIEVRLRCVDGTPAAEVRYDD
ncbi:hypothetical protein [Actinophytocola glycyrrhizae]|uniref:Septum formation initiator n=1 Tax=Actinophytocola glycyrrhizae TaxID=2044873 RepID=A0ABV9S3H3_9PSEU